MNIASQNLCQELYALIGWVDPTSPAGYNLGYLLRKLPASIDGVDAKAWLHIVKSNSLYEFFYHDGSGMTLKNSPRADGYTPEDAAAKLAIELFKQGILVRDTPNNQTSQDKS